MGVVRDGEVFLLEADDVEKALGDAVGPAYEEGGGKAEEE